VLRLTCGRSQLGLANVVVKRTTSRCEVSELW
jgi:hypothetical protein